MKELALSPKLQTHLASASLAKADAFSPSRFMHEALQLYNQWVDKQSQQSEQFLEPLPDITPSMVQTTSHPAAFLCSPEQDTIVVPPTSDCIPHK
jgi:hypothetical protein